MQGFVEMGFFTENMILIMFLPLWTSLILLAEKIFDIVYNRKTTVILTLVSTFIGIIFSVMLLNKTVTTPDSVYENIIYNLETGFFSIPLGTRTDKYSAVFLTVYMIISFLIQLFSYSRLKHKIFFTKYYLYCNLLNFSVAGVFLSPGFVQFLGFTVLCGFITYLISENDTEPGSTTATDRLFQSSQPQKFGILNTLSDSFLLFCILITSCALIQNTHDNAISLLTFDDIGSLKIYLGGNLPPEINGILSIFLLLFVLIKTGQLYNRADKTAGLCTIGIYFAVRIFSFSDGFYTKLICIAGITSAIIHAIKAVRKTDTAGILSSSSSSVFGIIIILTALGKVDSAVLFFIIHAFAKTILYFINERTKDISGIGLYEKTALIIASLSLSGLFFGGLTSFCRLINGLSPYKPLLFSGVSALFLTAFYTAKIYYLINHSNFGKKPGAEADRTDIAAILLPCMFLIIPGFVFNTDNLNITVFISYLICFTGAILGYYCIKRHNGVSEENK